MKRWIRLISLIFILSFMFVLVGCIVSINPNDEGEYIYFGLYPQTVVDDANLIEELDKLVQTNSNGYYVFEGNEYAKLSANPYGSSPKFSNEETIISGKTYYFKVEPIKWRILEKKDGTLTLLADMILDQEKFYISADSRTIDETTIYANNYEHSIIREWLNNDFYNKAFNSVDKSNILTSFVDNSARTTTDNTNEYACDDTNDKVYLLSCQEAKYTYFNNDEKRQATASDYARARYVYAHGDNDTSSWWLRSPYSSSDSYYVLNVGNEGTIHYFGAHCVNFGVRPALRIKND